MRPASDNRSPIVGFVWFGTSCAALALAGCGALTVNEVLIAKPSGDTNPSDTRFPPASSTAMFPVGAFGKVGAAEIGATGLDDPRVARLLATFSLDEDDEFSGRFPAERWARVHIGLADGRSLDQDTAASMIDATERGIRTKHAGDTIAELVFQDLDDTMAAVKVRTGVYLEYLHLVRLREGWKILNALWRRV